MILKTGAEVPSIIVAAHMKALRKLLAENRPVLWELVLKCRDPNHMFFGAPYVNRVLRERKLIQTPSNLHDATRNIVLSAVVGDTSENMIIVLPEADGPRYAESNKRLQVAEKEKGKLLEAVAEAMGHTGKITDDIRNMAQRVETLQKVLDGAEEAKGKTAFEKELASFMLNAWAKDPEACEIYNKIRHLV